MWAVKAIGFVSASKVSEQTNPNYHSLSQHSSASTHLQACYIIIVLSGLNVKSTKICIHESCDGMAIRTDCEHPPNVYSSFF